MTTLRASGIARPPGCLPGFANFRFIHPFHDQRSALHRDSPRFVMGLTLRNCARACPRTLETIHLKGISFMKTVSNQPQEWKLVSFRECPTLERIITRWQRFSSGVWQMPKGDICAAYSGQTLPRVSVFRHQGRMFTTGGILFLGTVHAEANRISTAASLEAMPGLTHAHTATRDT